MPGPVKSRCLPRLDLQAARIATERLRLHPDNPHRGDLDALKQSLEANGQYRRIVVNRPSTEVLAGHHTLRAARELGWTDIAVAFVEVDESRRAESS